MRYFFRSGIFPGFVAPALLLAGLLVGCAPARKVARVSPESTIDLSGRWNDVDSREVGASVVRDALASPWSAQWMQSHNGRKPVVIVGVVRNRTAEHIPIGALVADIERELVNSGQVSVVATAAERGELREEREDQWRNATEETAKKMGRELGADFMLGGTIESMTDREGGERVLFYQAAMSLINVETNEKVWMGGHKIKKVVSQSRYAP